MANEEAEIPQYRIERIATGEEIHQAVINVLRRMMFLPIKKTSRQAYNETVAKLPIPHPNSAVVKGSACD